MNRPATIKQADVTRVVKGAVKAGFAIGRIEVDQSTGRVIIYPEGADAQGKPNEWDDVLR